MIMKALIVFLAVHMSLASDLPGHLERLGKQRKGEGHIDILDELPSPLDFYDKHVKPGRPAVFKGAAKPMPAFKDWTDEYLRTKFANLRFDIEEGKKENRSQRSYVYSMKDFIDKYRTEDVYMVHSIAKEMRGDVALLPIISCGGYVNLLQDIVMWFSSGGTSSVLHSDGVDNINCLFSGQKELFMVDKKYVQYIDIDAPEGGYSKVDPDSVDLKKYPDMSKAPWWEAKMEAGDCLFIPVGWWHQVRSFNRNIAVNVWFNHPNHINQTDCEGKDWKNYVPLNEFRLKSIEGAKQMISLEVKAKGKLSKRDFMRFMSTNLHVVPEQMKEIFAMVDKNGDNYITMDDVDGLTDKDLGEIKQLMPMGSDYGHSDETDVGDEEDIPPEGSDGEMAQGGDGTQNDDGYDDKYDTGEPGVGKISDNDLDSENEDKYHSEL